MERSEPKTTRIASRLSSTIKDPVVRRAFEWAERTYPQRFTIPDEPTALQPALPRHQPQVLDGGAAAERELEVVS